MYNPYWPDENNTVLVFDDVQVKYVRHSNFKGIIVRKFLVSKGTDEVINLIKLMALLTGRLCTPCFTSVVSFVMCKRIIH